MSRHYTGRHHFPSLNCDVDTWMLHDEGSTMRIEPIKRPGIAPWQLPRDEWLACLKAEEFIPNWPGTEAAPERPVKTAEDWERERLANQAKIDAERATWDQYATVRDATARGFTPSAYGRAQDDGGPLLQPPTKFNYTAGAIAHPHACGGPEGRFLAWSFEHDSPDALRYRRVWSAGDPNTCDLHPVYTTVGNFTFDEALAWCEASDRHARQHFIIADWIDGCPSLTAAEWRELAALPVATPEPTTRDMFAEAPPPTPDENAQRAISLIAHGRAADERITLTGYRDLYTVENLIRRANYERRRPGLPPIVGPFIPTDRPVHRIASPGAAAATKTRYTADEMRAGILYCTPEGQLVKPDSATYTVLADVKPHPPAAPYPTPPRVQAALF